MKLTPLDIRHREFKRGMRGYADAEVDEFLDEVADEYERLFKENIDLREQVEGLEEKVTQYRRIEETLQKTLISAQASAEELRQNATKEAQLILRDAELKSRQMVNETYSEKQAIEQATAKLRSAQQDFSFKFRQLLEGYLQQLDETPPAEGRAVAQTSEFDRQAEAIKAAIAREATPAAVPRKPAVATAAAQGDEADAHTGAPEGEDRAVAAVPDAPDDGAGVAADAEAGAAAPPKERVSLGEHDLMADVESGVNENEFKW